MRIGLISDTHVPESREELWPQAFDAFRPTGCVRFPLFSSYQAISSRFP